MMISIKAILPFTDLDLQSPIFEKISRSMAVPDMTPEPDWVLTLMVSQTGVN